MDFRNVKPGDRFLRVDPQRARFAPTTVQVTRVGRKYVHAAALHPGGEYIPGYSREYAYHVEDGTMKSEYGVVPYLTTAEEIAEEQHRAELVKDLRALGFEPTLGGLAGRYSAATLAAVVELLRKDGG